MMSKVRFLTISVVALLLLNLGFTAFFLFNNQGPRREGPRGIIIERLHFDAQQIEAFDRLAQHHRKEIRQKQEAISIVKQQVYSLLKNDEFSKKDSLIAIVGQLQEEAEIINFEHFKAIKSLCRGSQVADFEILADELARFFPRNGPPPKK
jgi:periplasmic protein CpxP/Spy